MTKVDELIAKFKELKEELKEELNKGVNASYTPSPNATTGTSGGQGGMYRSEAMDKMISAPAPEPDHINGVRKDIGFDSMAMSEETLKFDKNGQWSLDKSAFKTLQHKIEREGHSKDSAAAITASIGRKSIGEKAMEERSKEARKADEVTKPNTSPMSNPNAVASSGPQKGYGPMNPSSTALPRFPTTTGRPKRVNKVDPEENVNIPHPKGKAKMANGVNKNEDSEGTNQRIANPPEKDCPDPRGRIHMVKDEGTNEEAGTSRPHNKGKFKVMDEVKEKSSEKASPKGKPYSDKGEVNKQESADAKGYEEQRAQNKARHDCFGI